MRAIPFCHIIVSSPQESELPEINTMDTNGTNKNLNRFDIVSHFLSGEEGDVALLKVNISTKTFSQVGSAWVSKGVLWILSFDAKERLVRFEVY